MCWKSNMKLVRDFRLMAGQLFKESHYHKHFGQWQGSFQLKAALPLVKRLAVASCRLSCAGWMILRTEASVIHGRPTSPYMVLSCSTQMINNVIRKHLGFPLCTRSPYKHPGNGYTLILPAPDPSQFIMQPGLGSPAENNVIHRYDHNTHLLTTRGLTRPYGSILQGHLLTQCFL